MIEFTFVFNTRIRQILERDYAELQQLDTLTSTKAVLVLSGGIIEGLLFDALVSSGKWTFEQACQNFLKDMIGPAKNRGIITEDRLTDVTRKYRNLIHPGREIKENMLFEENDAVLAKTAVDIIAREVSHWANSERNRRQLRTFLTQLNEDELELLQLFATPPPSDPNLSEHPFLKNSVYRSADSLTGHGVLNREVNGAFGNLRETITLVPEALELVEELVIKNKVQRVSITLDLRKIAASGAGGSGAPTDSRIPPTALKRIDDAPSRSKFPVFIEVNKNQAIVEEFTEVIVALNDVFQNRKALFTITLPGKEPQQFPEMSAGHVWRFERDRKRYRMTLLEVSYIKDRAKLEIRRDPDIPKSS